LTQLGKCRPIPAACAAQVPHLFRRVPQGKSLQEEIRFQNCSKLLGLNLHLEFTVLHSSILAGGGCNSPPLILLIYLNVNHGFRSGPAATPTTRLLLFPARSGTSGASLTGRLKGWKWNLEGCATTRSRLRWVLMAASLQCGGVRFRPWSSPNLIATAATTGGI